MAYSVFAKTSRKILESDPLPRLHQNKTVSSYSCPGIVGVSFVNTLTHIHTILPPSPLSHTVGFWPIELLTSCLLLAVH
ncbi:hypothetical protein L596_003659 [Steinernema carpocapsae]|uniref:Uncharacterized protein n=1 Tax=Steinernema carpocapsae TaxID=34508 RepID=A0A4U8UT95_STECR|nr:hypothetical protein L596_003659 [Steinernema carpocapsae]